MALVSKIERNDAPIVLTANGFKFGPASVDCVTTLRDGSVCLRIETPKAALNFRVTKTGVLRVYTDLGFEALFGDMRPSTHAQEKD